MTLVPAMQRHFWLWIVRGDDDLPQEFWNYAYPLSFFEITSQYTVDSVLDPFRSGSDDGESLFDPHAMSPVGALGLMQFPCSSTGGQVSVGFVTENRLFRPVFAPGSISLLGTIIYLKQLLELFDQELPPVIASYNAGEQRCQEWRQNADHNDPAALGLP